MQSNGENALAPEDSEVLPSEASEILKTTEEVEKKQSISSANGPVVAKKKVNEVKTADYSANKRAALPVHRDLEDKHTALSSSNSVCYLFIF